MEEKMIMMDVLTTEKCMVVNTVTAMNEASSTKLYSLFSDFFNTISEETKDIFGLCYKNGWYQLEEAPANKVEQEAQKLCSELNKED